MGVITNIISTIFTSTGAGDVTGDTERLGRAQTRLGQSSAGAGRQFAAQASGLGGLVAAYAGAAATSFALTAAFNSLANAARAMQTIEGVNTLAADYAQAGSKILTSIKDITQGQLTLAEAAEQASLGLSAGFKSDQIEGLATVALKASRALGRDLTDSMTRVVRGSAKMETELLDELGIYTKIEPATRAYAAAIGKTVGQLSEYERRQAFVNSVIAEGQRKFSSINTTIPTSAQQIEALGTKLVDIATKLGGMLADMLAPLASGIVENITATIGTLGIVLSLVASKGVQLFEASMAKLIASMEAGSRATENTWRRWTKAEGAAKAATAATKALTDAQLRLNEANNASLAGLRKTAESRMLSRGEIRKTNDLLKVSKTALEQEKAQLLAKAQQARAAYSVIAQSQRDAVKAHKDAQAATKAEKDRTVTGGINTPAARQKAQEMRRLNAEERAAQTTARAAIAAQTAARQSMQPGMRATNALLRQNTKDLAVNTAAINANNAAIYGWRARLSAFMGVAAAPFKNFAGNIGTVLGGVMGLASKAFFLVSIFQLVGSAIANAIGKGDEFNALFVKLGKTISSYFSSVEEQTNKKNLLGITAGSLANLEKANALLRETSEFTYKQKSVFGIEIEITKTKDQLVKEVSNIMLEAGQEGGNSFSEALTSSTALGLAGLGATLGAFASLPGMAIGAAAGYAAGTIIDYMSQDDISDLATKYGAEVRAKFGEQISELSDDIEEQAVKALSIIQDKYSNQALIDPMARAAKELQEQLVLSSIESLRTIEAIGQVIAATSKSAADVNKSFDFKTATDGISNISDKLEYVSEGITAIGDKRIRFLFIDDMNEQFKKIADTVVLTGTTINSALDLQKLKNLPSLSGLDISDSELSKTIDSIIAKVNDQIAMGTDQADILPLLRADTSGLEQAILLQIEDVSTLDGLITNLGDSYNILAGSINESQRSSLLASQVLRSTNEELARGTITLERFTQNIDNSRSALIDSTKELAKAKVKQLEFAAAVAVTQKGTDEGDEARNALAAIEQQVSALEQANNVQREILKGYLAQEESIRKQIELTTFLKDQGKGVLSDIEFQFELAKAGATEAKQASVEFFATQIEGNKAASKEAALYREAVLSAIDADPDFRVKVPEEAIAAVLSASKQTTADVELALQGVDSKLLRVVDGMVIVNDKFVEVGNSSKILVEQASQNAFDIVGYSTDALKKLGQQTAIEIAQLSKKFGETIASTIADVQKQLSDLEQNSRLEKLQFGIDMADIAAQGAQAAFEFEQAFKANQIKKIELEVDLKKKTPVQGAEEINQLESEILASRTAAIAAEKEAASIRYTLESSLLTEKQAAEERRIQLESDATKAKIQSEYNVLKAAVETYGAISQQLGKAIVDGGNTMGGVIVAAINSGVQAFVKSFGPLGKMLGLSAQTAEFNAAPVPGTDQISTGIGYITEAEAEMNIQLSSLDGALNTTITSLDKLASEQKRYAAESVAREKEQLLAKYQEQVRAIDRSNILNDQQKEIEKLNAEKRLKDALAAGGDKKIKEIDKKLQALFDSIKGHIETALMGLNNLIFYGEGNFGDIMGNLFKSIQQDFFKQTVADPLSNMLTTSIFGSLGVGVTKGEKGLTFNTSDNSLLVRVVNASEFGLAGGLGGATDPNNPQATGVVGWMSSLFGKDGTVSGFFSNLFGEGGILSNLLSGFGSFLGSIFKAIFGGIFGGGGMFGGGKVTGGIMHMAQGGVAGSSALRRDRIPALLEPGEFVVRKPAARMIGTPALNALNANGRMPNGGAPTINLVNEGSPKDVQQAKPRFDGEKYVIDIILRDLSNNGPIRRSLRGGSS